jgi:hypothetical protein
MRPGQHNNKRNRNRNRRHGGNQGGGGGNGANRVYDSNGPDVKLRGTAQTVAEKYMQLGRDAQSSGDTVMAESYYQFADHYYRIWLAAQPAGQPIQFSRRMAEEEFEDGDQAEGEAEGAEGEVPEGAEGVEAAAPVEGGEQPAEGEGQQLGYQNRNNGNRDFRNNRDNREGGNRFRQRWPRRFDRNNQDGQPNGNVAEGNGEGGERQDRHERNDRYERQERPHAEERAAPQESRGDDSGNWEAPSFLRRPAAVNDEAQASDEAAQPRPRGRRPRAADPVEDAPQGD